VDFSAVTRYMRAEIEARYGPTAPTLDDLVRPLAAKTFEPLPEDGNGKGFLCGAGSAAAPAARGGGCATRRPRAG
jgi:hypothetical protein